MSSEILPPPNAESNAESDDESDDSAPPSGEPAEAVLVVVEEKELRRLIALELRAAGFAVVTAETGCDAIAAACARPPCVVVLDMMLPDMLGTAACAALRQQPSVADAGIVVLTSAERENDRMRCLEVGADDYVRKPCSVRELVLRIRLLARRARDSRIARRVTARPGVYRWKGVMVDFERRRVTVDGAIVSLRPLELKLLATLMPSAGTLFSRAELMRIVWGIEGHTDSRTLDTHVRRLRERLGPYGDAIETSYGLGYRWREEEVTGVRHVSKSA